MASEFRSARLRVVATVAVCLLSAAAAPGARATPPLVTVQLPQKQTVGDLLRGKFVQTVTCRRSCKVIAQAFIPAQVARKLHFAGVKRGAPYAVALRQVELKSGKPTRIYMRLGSDAKKRLATWKKTLRLTGETYAESTSLSVRGQANWITLLRR